MADNNRCHGRCHVSENREFLKSTEFPLNYNDSKDFLVIITSMLWPLIAFTGVRSRYP